MRRRMEKTPDLTDKQVATTGPKSQEDWKKKALYNISSERPHPGNTSEAAQERTSSSRDRDIEPDAGIAFPNRRQMRRGRRWRENRRNNSAAPASTENQTHWHRIQDSKAESGPDDGTSNTSELGELKGGWNLFKRDKYEDYDYFRGHREFGEPPRGTSWWKKGFINMMDDETDQVIDNFEDAKRKFSWKKVFW